MGQWKGVGGTIEGDKNGHRGKLEFGKKGEW